jgi:intein/homing endonuclease
MLEFVRSRILGRQGSFLRPLDAHDMMCAVGNAAVSGGVRRTAMISLFDYDDNEMRLCKNGDFERENSQRWNANNSAIWPQEGMTQPEFVRRFLEMVDSGRGEPGIFHRPSAKMMRPERRQDAEFGTNPCVTGDTWVLTDQGPRQVADLVGVEHTTIIDGQRYATTEAGFWETGVKPVLRLSTNEGYTLRLTANHKVLSVPYISRKTERTIWVEAGTLQPGDKIKLHNHRELQWEGDGTFDEGWLLGSLIGDGTFDYKSAKLTFWGENRTQMAERAVTIIRQTLDARADLKGYDQPEHNRTVVQSVGLRNLAADYGIYRGMKTITPLLEQTSSDFHRGFLQGLFDADGAVIGTQRKGVSVRLAQSDSMMLEAVQRMLLRLGITAALYRNRRTAGMRLLPDGRGDYHEYMCRADHELVIANDNLQVFAENIGFSDTPKQARLTQKLDGYARALNRERFVVTVERIDPDGEAMVYDCSVPDVHAFDANGLYVHNCGEIVLRPWQFCNLTAAVARADDTFETLRDKVEAATLIGSIQSMATHFPGLRPMWEQNCVEERLLGVDITGQMDSPIAQDARVKEHLRQIAIEVNRQTAQALGINQSAAITCVKPSGNSSQLLDCSSGLHARWAPYYIRNIRVAATSPLFKVMHDAGVPMDPENGQTPESANTWVIHFPVKSPDAAITRNDRTAVEQCEFWLQNKLHWTEHNPSVTITYRPEEVIDLIKWVWEHRDAMGGMAFLPAFDANYSQMPYVEITQEEYERLVASFPEIDFSKIYRYEDKDLTNAAQEMACVSGNCEIDL